ncbi:MAG TPA: hypothetical protein VJY54_02400 [Lachnospiraceae bacterium]|jgi:hypothetical protein|nr:hypothetical protein [Lachnospiraceae bacterium]
MSILLKVLLFIVKLPFRIIALAASFVLGVISVMLQMVMGMGMTLISLFNIFVLVGFIATIWAKDWQAALGLVVLLVIEGVVITIGSIITAALTVIKDNLLSFCLGNRIV